jgi:hypothetical protein
MCRTVREIFAAMKRSVVALRSKEESEQIMVSVVFLRFLCPSLIDPVNFGIYVEQKGIELIIIIICMYIDSDGNIIFMI